MVELSKHRTAFEHVDVYWETQAYGLSVAPTTHELSPCASQLFPRSSWAAAQHGGTTFGCLNESLTEKCHPLPLIWGWFLTGSRDWHSHHAPSAKHMPQVDSRLSATKHKGLVAVFIPEKEFLILLCPPESTFNLSFSNICLHLTLISRAYSCRNTKFEFFAMGNLRPSPTFQINQSNILFHSKRSGRQVKKSVSKQLEAIPASLHWPQWWYQQVSHRKEKGIQCL